MFAALGLALFVYFVQRAGLTQIWSYLQRLGVGFLIILALAGGRFVVRAYAWTLCFEAPHRLRFRDAFKAYLIGDAAGNILPLGIVVSEPVKAAMVRERVPLVAGLSAIAIENLFYSLSVALFILGGVVSLLGTFPLTKALRWSSVGILVGLLVVMVVAFLVVRMQWKILSGALERLYARGIGRKFLERRRERVRALEDRIYGFYARNRTRFLPILLLEGCFHLLGVSEVYVTLSFISDVPPTLLTAFLLESVNRVINIAFKFVPLRVGIDEAGTELMTNVLRFSQATGVTLAIVRKIRMLCWTGIGVALLVSRGLSLRAMTTEAENAVASEIKRQPDLASTGEVIEEARAH